VILAAYYEWGPDCLSRLNGMFVLALYDSRRRQLLLARDRAGEKPLYYARVNGALMFASELKALMAHPQTPRIVDPDALDCYLAMGYVPGGLCMLRGVQKLPPAHALLFDVETARTQLWRYWQAPQPDLTPATGRDMEAALLDELEVLLQDAVRRQLVADVPVGVLLSGGIDSSLVTAMAVRAARKVKTFTVRFPGQGKYDETEHARLIARHFATDHEELDAAPSTVDLLPLLARQFDEPMADSSMIPTYLVSRLIREHCTVALGGDGGDELFGGYPKYSRLLWAQRKLAFLPRPVRILIARAARAVLPVEIKGRAWLQVLEADFAHGVPLISAFFERGMRRRLISEQRSWPLVAEDIRDQHTARTPDLLQRATRMDFETYLADDILVKVDRASMLNSLEVRAPMLDYRVIEFALGKVPSHLKATPTGRKVLLKKLAARVLPPEFDRHRKQGFEIPLGSWLQAGPWQNFFRDVLLAADQSLFSHAMLRKLLDAQAQGRANGDRLFALVMFELWRREYQISI
jgi:asparagine synthase (glutamine-hydrolysing)